MLILYDFKCDKCGETEELLLPRHRADDTPKHKYCGGTLTRIITPIRFKLEGHSGHFPTAASKWERQHEKAGREPSETDPSGW